MIDVQYISDERSLSEYYLFSGGKEEDMQLLANISITRLKVREAGFDSMINEELEFQKLTEVSLTYFLTSHEILALFVEGMPAPKRKLRSYAGMFYRLKRQLGDELFIEQELSLPGNKSLFVGMMKVEVPVISVFLKELISSRFIIGILKERDKEQLQTNEELLNCFYKETISIEKEKHVRINWLKGIHLLCGDNNIVFRLASDGQDNQYLEFYGPHELIESRIINTLLPRLKEHFYLRRRQPWMDAG